MKLKTGQKCAFGFGAFGKDIVYMLISSYLLYYYNVVLGMSSVFIGTVMMAARIFDAFNDPVMQRRVPGGAGSGLGFLPARCSMP